MTGMRNWAGNIAFSAAEIARPVTLDDLRAVVSRAEKVRAVGSGHSFNRIADTSGTLISLSALNRVIDIDRSAHTVTIQGGATYGDIVSAVHGAGYGLGNVASLPHITVAGAVGTATHGSGDRNRNLAAAVSALKLVGPDGNITTLRRGDPDFEGAVVGLGALGIVSELTLDLVPSFDIRQNVYLDLPLPALLANFDGLMASAYSVSFFTRWQGDVVDQAWIKALPDGSEPAGEILGARAADRAYHPIAEFDGAQSTIQMGVVGPWHERLFHFPVTDTPSAGAELQSEFFVARADALAAIQALHAVQETFSGALFVSEIRSVAADELWLSSAYRQDTIGFHFTWRPDWEPALAAVRSVEAALAPFRPRPHWAKVFTIPSTEIASRYPRFDDFRQLADRLDPAGKFRNRYLEDVVFARG